MKNIILKIAILICLVAYGIDCHADMGPKPKMTFNIYWGTAKFGKPTRILQIQSNNKDFTECDTIKEEGQGPQRIVFIGDGVRSLAYGFKKYQKLAFFFKDTIVLTEQFSPAGYSSEYELKVNDSGIEVINKTPFFYRNTEFPAYIKALIITLFAEILFSFIVLGLFKYQNKKKFILWLIPANIISISVFWWIIMSIFNSGWGFLGGEIFVLFFETTFMWYFLKKEIPYGKTMGILFFLNLMSMLMGGFFKFIAFFGVGTDIFW